MGHAGFTHHFYLVMPTEAPSLLSGYAAYALAETAKQFTNEIFTDQRTGEHLILRSIETYFEINSHLSCQV